MHNVTRKYLILILFCLLSTGFAMQNRPEDNSDIVINILANKENFDYYKIKSLITKINNLTAMSLGRSSLTSLTFNLNKKIKNIFKIKRDNDSFTIYLTQDYNMLKYCQKLHVKLLKIVVLNSLDIQVTKRNLNNANWLVYAINRKLDRILFPKIYLEKGSFPGIHSLMISECKLTPESIIKYPVPFKDYGPNFIFYSEVCEILLNTVLSVENGQTILAEYFQKLSTKNGENDFNLFYNLYKKDRNILFDKAKQSFDRKLNTIAFDSSMNSYIQAEPKFILKEFTSIFSYSYKLKESSDVIHKGTIDNLPQIIEKMEAPEVLLNHIILKFNRLKKFVPTLFYEPIDGIVSLLKDLQRGKNIKLYKTKVDKYRNQFRNTAVIEKQIEDLLIEVEGNSIRVPVKYKLFFQVIDDESTFLAEIWPDLNNYLDTNFKVY